MNTAATEIGEQRVLGASERFVPSPDTGDCICVICQPSVYAKRDALNRLDKTMEAWSDALVDSENRYTTAGDDLLFDILHTKLNAMQDVNIDAIQAEDERIRTLRGE